MSTAKSYDISKLTVWEAYQSVKANRGAAGIDEQSIAQFEQKLQRNLYKLWNRMSSGSYLPPPVRQVEIPKQSGGKRKLGIPTVADRVAQTVVKLLLSNNRQPTVLQKEKTGARGQWRRSVHSSIRGHSKLCRQGLTPMPFGPLSHSGAKLHTSAVYGLFPAHWEP